MRKIIIISTILIITCIVFLSGCSKKEISLGKYYLQGEQNSYIEISAGNEISFFNFDWSFLDNEYQEEYGLEGTVVDVMWTTFDVAEDYSKIWVPLELYIDDHQLALTFQYSINDKTISFLGPGNNIYIWIFKNK